jgi:hypothetical protein
MILTSACRALPKMVACLRKPANICRIDRTDQGVLARAAQDRARNYEHVLPGEAFAEFD